MGYASCGINREDAFQFQVSRRCAWIWSSRHRRFDSKPNACRASGRANPARRRNGSPEISLVIAVMRRTAPTETFHEAPSLGCLPARGKFQPAACVTGRSRARKPWALSPGVAVLEPGCNWRTRNIESKCPGSSEPSFARAERTGEFAAFQTCLIMAIMVRIVACGRRVDMPSCEVRPASPQKISCSAVRWFGRRRSKSARTTVPHDSRHFGQVKTMNVTNETSGDDSDTPRTSRGTRC